MGRNTLCQEFVYGEISQGYWTYDHMFLQLEDCTKILKALHTGIDFIFLFDNPCGHVRGREEILNVIKMNSGYDGTQQDMLPKKSISNLVALERMI